MSKPKIFDFGGWVKQRLLLADVAIAALARESGIVYPSLSNILNRGQSGKLSRQDSDTVAKIATALVKLNVIEDEREAWAAAGFMPEGYKVVKDGAPPIAAVPPENFADWPEELREALSFTRDLTPEVQVYIYQLWREQARASANIEHRRREAERQLNVREERLRRERSADN